MNMIMVSVKDVKSDSFSEPRTVPSVAVACRSFEIACKDENGDFYKWPEDWILYQVGEWDPVDGIVSVHKEPLVRAAAIVKRDLELRLIKEGE